ncbi:M20/M25/M40 family metallo-hydrolase [Novosphingobium ginsenosidimutans]|uniref:M20/M25/M40 family metallo-hydrolase n=1 Tax=Novosphingobium ginsenosidimutans TaxID=1176536 RepID=A0A5B8S2L2_9SPHN|nr:M20/M25/M40 family metallo-hydrolase [Novosphingobium ginsenosidimutans]QEA15358.1 M20/M25/M40 family metallo-hydrolase [Novosphingobium ginsenosidimutans]
MRRSALLLAATLAVPAMAAPPKVPSATAEAQVLELSKQSIALRSVQGGGNRTIDVAKLYKTALLGAGWAEKDIEITPVDDTAYLVATWQGSDPKLKPLIISGHMDVVEANPKDWTRDPFTPVVENGYLYGRGASDQKFSEILAMVGLMELRKGGFKPKRTIIIAFSGDEETTMKTGRILADRFADADMVLNTDGSGGALDEATGKPLYWTWDGAEKTYVDIQLEVTNAGGHSSAPRAENAIAQLSQALARIGDYRFKAEQNPLTKAYFEKAAQFESDPKLAAAMRAFAANVNDEAAVATLRTSTGYVGKVGTTCVPTMVHGGHAVNALPQRATANVNCRVFPGHTRAQIIAELEKVAGVPEVKFTDVTGETATESNASPMRPDYLAAVDKAMAAAWPKVPVIPAQSSGASDSMWYRAKGVPSYGISPIFIKDSDDFSHGLNERVELRNIRPGLIYYFSLLPALSK